MKKKKLKNQIARRKKAFKRRKQHEAWKKNKNRTKFIFAFRLNREQKRKAQQAIRARMPTAITLPKNFSFINNPKEVLDFFHTLQRHLKNKIQVLLDFEDVEIITSDILALLMAKFSNSKFTYGTRAWIKNSSNPEINNLLFESGFLKLIGGSKNPPTHGLLNTKKNTIVDIEVAVSARKLASQKTFGSDKKMPPLYRTLIECMANTKKHASGSHTGDETWWLAVYNKPGTKTTAFTFCDTGVGIFKSSKLAPLTKIAVSLGIKKNSDILMQILEGKIGSSTGLHYRGKGLPKIYADYNNLALKKLVIAANDVFADFDNGTFVELKKQLNGTFLYWEITPN